MDQELVMEPRHGAHGTAEAGKPWDVEIDVHLVKACPDPVFHLDTYLPIDPATGYIQFDNNHRPGFNVTFNLYDETGAGYTFPPQSKVDDACWSQLGTACPKTAKWDVLQPRNVSPDRLSLTVFNDNPGPPNGPLGVFKYALRVTKDNGANYCDLDPGGVDNNGARTFVSE